MGGWVMGRGRKQDGFLGTTRALLTKHWLSDKVNGFPHAQSTSLPFLDKKRREEIIIAVRYPFHFCKSLWAPPPIFRHLRMPQPIPRLPRTENACKGRKETRGGLPGKRRRRGRKDHDRSGRILLRVHLLLLLTLRTGLSDEIRQLLFDCHKKYACFRLGNTSYETKKLLID